MILVICIIAIIPLAYSLVLSYRSSSGLRVLSLMLTTLTIIRFARFATSQYHTAVPHRTPCWPLPLPPLVCSLTGGLHIHWHHKRRVCAADSGGDRNSWATVRVRCGEQRMEVLPHPIAYFKVSSVRSFELFIINAHMRTQDQLPRMTKSQELMMVCDAYEMI